MQNYQFNNQRVLLKEFTDWRIAAVYYVIGGFFIPRGISFIVTLIMAKIAEIIYVSIYFFIALDFIIITLALWLGASYAAKYISRRYVIRNKNNIVKNAVIFFVLISLGGLGMLLAGQNMSSVGIAFLEAVFATGLFYFLTDKYIRNTEIISVEAEPAQPDSSQKVNSI